MSLDFVQFKVKFRYSDCLEAMLDRFQSIKLSVSFISPVESVILQSSGIQFLSQ